jgi:hypothetical protein
MAEFGMPKKERDFRTRDARGRSVSMLDPYTLHVFRRHDVIPAGPLGAIASEVGSGLSPKARKLAIFFTIGWGLCVLVFLVSCVDMLVNGDPRGFFSMSRVFLIQVWFWPLMVWIGTKRARFNRIRGAMLSHRRCPHCGYDLRLLPVDPTDGATVCPECGCAWKLAGIRQAAESVEGEPARTDN